MAVRIVEVLVFTNSFIAIYASYHWKVTENGKISSEVKGSGFPLMREYDFLVLLQQEERLKKLTQQHTKLTVLKNSIYKQWNKIKEMGNFEKNLYASDTDCLLGEIPLNQHNLNIDFLDYAQNSRKKMNTNYETVEPDCTIYSDLDFSMRTFPHLETLNRRSNSNLSLYAVPWTSKTKSLFDVNIDAMLRHNSSDWTAYNFASFYWRLLGNGTNALECARRALYFAPWSKRYIVLLNLGTLLQELESLEEAAIVLHSAVDHDPVCHISHLALGNVYTALGNYNRSLACYENVLSLNPDESRALKLKHALLCHEKLEKGLLNLHADLKHILKDLQRHNAVHENMLFLQNQINWEKNTVLKEFYAFSEPIYVRLQMIIDDVEEKEKKVMEGYKPKSRKNYSNRQELEIFKNFESLENFEGLESDEDHSEPQDLEKSGKKEEEKKKNELYDDIDDDGSINSGKFLRSDIIKRKIKSLISLFKSA